MRLDYLGKEEENNVYLETQAKEDVVTVTSQQFAQEGELGNKVAFDFALERLTEGEKEFRLLTIGLPEKYHHRYIETQRGGAAVRRVKFTRRLRRINLALEVDIPRELPAEELLKPIKFYGVIADNAGLKQLRPFLRGETLPTTAQLRAAKVGFEQLELVPRGIGEMQISARGYYYRTKPADEVEIRFFLENTGTSRLDDIHFEIIPSDPMWRYRLEPEKVESIEPAQKAEIKLVLHSETPMEIGEYSLEVEATCELSGKEILAEEDSFRIHVEGETDVTLAAVILGTFLALVIGIAVMSIKISRR